MECSMYPFCSSRRNTVRMVDSFMGRVEESASRHSSDEHGPEAQTWSITACSTSPNPFARLPRVMCVLFIVALQVVTEAGEAWQHGIGKQAPCILKGLFKVHLDSPLRGKERKIERDPTHAQSGDETGRRTGTPDAGSKTFRP